MRFIRLGLALVLVASATFGLGGPGPALGQEEPEGAAPQEASLRLKLSRDKLVFGKSVRVTARLRVEQPARNRTVRVYKRPRGAASGTLHAKGRVDAEGRFRVWARPSRNTRYWAEWTGDANHGPATSEEKTVGVRLKMQRRLRGHDHRHGKWFMYAQADTIRVRVTARPKRNGDVWYVIQRKFRGSWRNYPWKADPTNSSPPGHKTRLKDGVANRNFKSRRDDLGIGRYRVRAVFHGDTKHQWSATPWAYFQIDPGYPPF